MKPVLFLDFDGVLRTDAVDPPRCLNRGKLLLLDRLVAAAGCDLVLCTEWRTDPDRCRAALGGAGRHIVGATPADLGSIHNRADQVQAWLDMADVRPDRFAILDDWPAAAYRHLAPFVVQCDPAVGLTLDNVFDVLALLRTPLRS